MKRLFFIAENAQAAERLIDHLRGQGIEEADMHALARDDIPLKEITEPEIMDKVDVIPGMKRGLALGGATGMLAGLVVVTFPPAGMAVGGGALLASTAAGAGIGAWVSGLVGSSSPSTELKPFEDAVRSGRVLLLVDVPRERADAVRSSASERHPDVEVAGEGHALPPLA